jgi:hypothetical protein
LTSTANPNASVFSDHVAVLGEEPCPTDIPPALAPMQSCHFTVTGDALYRVLFSSEEASEEESSGGGNPPAATSPSPITTSPIRPGETDPKTETAQVPQGLQKAKSSRQGQVREGREEAAPALSPGRLARASIGHILDVDA